MFKKEFRSKLNKHGWLRAAKDGGNESQTWRRTKGNAIKSISDLILLHKKLPQEKRDELYNLQNFKKLFETLLSYPGNDDVVQLELANYLVERSLRIFDIQHRLQNKNTKVLASVISDYLDKASEICKDITYKEKIKRIEPSIPKEELWYLAAWSQLTTREKGNLASFFADVIDIITEEHDLKCSQIKDNVINGEFEDYYTKMRYFFTLTLNIAKDKVDLLITNKKGNDINQQFVVKSHNNDYLLYYGKEEINKMKEKGVL